MAHIVTHNRASCQCVYDIMFEGVHERHGVSELVQTDSEQNRTTLTSGMVPSVFFSFILESSSFGFSGAAFCYHSNGINKDAC